MKPLIIALALLMPISEIADTRECNQSTVLIETVKDNNCPECLPQQECPPVLACEEGYSCQLDDAIGSPTGEQQQDPPESGEAWIKTIISGALKDVPIDDSRWGDREADEVYARENDDFIVWYWPSGGKATFDPTRLGSFVKWYDYRIASGKSGGGGPIPLQAGMAIYFNDSGGGISIFQRVGDAPSPPPSVGKCTEFLAEYVNPEQSKLPAHRVYPMGQKMMITAWLGDSSSEMTKFANSGFTMNGPHWHTIDEKMKKYMAYAKREGLRAAHKLGHGAGSSGKLYPKMDNGPKEAYLFKRVKDEILRIVNNSEWNNMVDIWLTGAEELSKHITNPSDRTKATRYLHKMSEMVDRYDPQKRPLWMSDVTGISKSNMMVTHRYLDIVGPQAYLGRINPDSGYKTDAAMGHIARTISSTANELNARYPGRYPRAATASLDLLYEPIPKRATAEMLTKITEHWIYISLNNGLNGFQLYAWHGYASMSKKTRQIMEAAYLEHIKRLTDNNMDYAYLWGDRRNDLNVRIQSGPSKVHGYPTISMSNIQYGKDRFVVITNSAEENVKVEISGFPQDCESLLDMRTGNKFNMGTSISTSIEALGVRMYKVSK